MSKCLEQRVIGKLEIDERHRVKNPLLHHFKHVRRTDGQTHTPHARQVGGETAPDSKVRTKTSINTDLSL
jgi:hypothetical protein